MMWHPNIPSDPATYPLHRRSIRLRSYDYTKPGYYFVTLVTRQRLPFFGDVIKNEMVLSEIGRIVQDEWLKTPQIRREIVLDAFIVMPNHLHGIIIIQDDIVDAIPDVGARGTRPGLFSQPIHAAGHPPLPNWPPGFARRSLASSINGFKSAVTSRLRQIRYIDQESVWQRNYYEHIIRDEESLGRIRQYVADNPSRWASDNENLLN